MVLEMKVIFRYKKIKLKKHLVMAFLWSTLGIFSIVFTEEKNWFSYLYLPIGLLFFYFYFYDKNYGYIAYKNAFIKKQAFPKKQLDLNNLKLIKRDHNGITLISKNKKKLLIDHSIIEENDLEKLNNILNKYESKT